MWREIESARTGSTTVHAEPFTIVFDGLSMNGGATWGEKWIDGHRGRWPPWEKGDESVIGSPTFIKDGPPIGVEYAASDRAMYIRYGAHEVKDQHYSHHVAVIM
jgi:hypothetical protein